MAALARHLPLKIEESGYRKLSIVAASENGWRRQWRGNNGEERTAGIA
jgi:hypothetical protein